MVATAPIVAVLPFANQSGDPGQEYFSDGITEDLIAALGRFSSLRVVGRGTTFAYKGQAADPTRIGRELGARYVVEGSVRRAGDRVRVSVELTDARGGLHLWSERYEQDVADVFTVQDAIVQRLVGMLAVKVTRVEQERASAKPPADLAAYDYVLRGRQLLARRTRAANAEARELFRRAIELDPRYAAAHVGLGRAYMDAMLFGWTEWPTRALESAKELARKAVDLDDGEAGGHALLSIGARVRAALGPRRGRDRPGRRAQPRRPRSPRPARIGLHGQRPPRRSDPRARDRPLVRPDQRSCLDGPRHNLLSRGSAQGRGGNPGAKPRAEAGPGRGVGRPGGCLCGARA